MVTQADQFSPNRFRQIRSHPFRICAMAAVKEWLDTFGRGDLAAAFAAEGYDTLEGCSMMDWDEDLAGLEGMKKGFKKVLLAQIEALKVKLTPQPPPGQPSAGAASPASRGGKVAASAATAPQINADGSSIQTLEDGTVVQKNANGVVIELRKGECAHKNKGREVAPYAGLQCAACMALVQSSSSLFHSLAPHLNHPTLTPHVNTSPPVSLSPPHTLRSHPPRTYPQTGASCRLTLTEAPLRCGQTGGRNNRTRMGR